MNGKRNHANTYELCVHLLNIEDKIKEQECIVNTCQKVANGSKPLNKEIFEVLRKEIGLSVMN